VRGTAFQLVETGAVIDRRAATAACQQPPLSQEDRAALNAAGVKVGRIAAWLPGLLKPSAARLALALRAVHASQPSRLPPTQSSFPLAKAPWPESMLWTAGYLRVGPRAIRADLAERLVGSIAQIRRSSETSTFAIPAELAAQIGCPAADFPAVLRALGLKPAEKDRETGAVKLWRFPAQRTARPGAELRNAPSASAPSGPFAALAELIAPQPAPQHRRRRRHKRSDIAAPKAAS